MRWSYLSLLALACGGEIELDVDSPEGLGSFCDEATPQPTTLRIDFPAKAPGCAWGEDGNLDAAQGRVTARIEEFIQLEVPEGSVICDMNLDFQIIPDVAPTMEYDDNMFFTYNRVVLAASYAPLVDMLPTERGLPLYDWETLRGNAFDFDPNTPTYCLGEAEGRSQCDIPPPEVEGTLLFDFDDDLVDELSFRALSLGTEEFGFVVIGDNDPEVDCSHQAFSFDVTVGLVER